MLHWVVCYKRDTSLHPVVEQFFCTSSLQGWVLTEQLMSPWHPEDLREKTTKGGGRGGGRKYNPLSVFCTDTGVLRGRGYGGMGFIPFTINYGGPTDSEDSAELEEEIRNGAIPANKWLSQRWISSFQPLVLTSSVFCGARNTQAVTLGISTLQTAGCSIGIFELAINDLAWISETIWPRPFSVD